MIEIVLFISAFQVFVLWNWNEEDGWLYRIKLVIAPRLHYRLLYKPIIECLTCQSWWFSVLSGLCLFLLLGIIGLMIIPICWILTIGGYRVIT